jgi:hypothetical protein
MESVFVHVTVVPIEIVSGLGLNALGPSAAAPLGIETPADDPDDGVGGIGVGDAGDEFDEFPEQPMTSIETTDTRLSRNDTMLILRFDIEQLSCQRLSSVIGQFHDKRANRLTCSVSSYAR